MRIPFELLIVLVILDNLLWFYIKYLSEQKGFKTGYSTIWHWRVILNLEKIMAKETDKKQKRKYNLTLLLFYSSAFFTSVLFCFWLGQGS